MTLGGIIVCTQATDGKMEGPSILLLLLLNVTHTCAKVSNTNKNFILAYVALALAIYLNFFPLEKGGAHTTSNRERRT